MHRHTAFDPLFDPRNMTSEDWLSMSEEAFSQRFATTPLTRSGLKRIQENVEEERAKREDERESWGLRVESWKLRVESWELKVESWKLKVESWEGKDLKEIKENKDIKEGLPLNPCYH